jgi:hypothetical protein
MEETEEKETTITENQFFLKKKKVIEDLTKMFPSIAAKLNIDFLQNSKKITVPIIRDLFWEHIRYSISNGDTTAKKLLSAAIKQELPTRGCVPRPSFDTLLSDLVFYC